MTILKLSHFGMDWIYKFIIKFSKIILLIEISGQYQNEMSKFYKIPNYHKAI